MKLTWQTRLVLLHRRLLTTERYKLAVTSLWIEHIDSLTTNFATKTDFEVCSYIWSSLCRSQLCELQKGQDESAWWDLHHPTPYISGNYQIPVVYHKRNNKNHVQTIHAWYILVRDLHTNVRDQSKWEINTSQITKTCRNTWRSSPLNNLTTRKKQCIYKACHWNNAFSVK